MLDRLLFGLDAATTMWPLSSAFAVIGSAMYSIKVSAISPHSRTRFSIVAATLLVAFVTLISMSSGVANFSLPRATRKQEKLVLDNTSQPTATLSFLHIPKTGTSIKLEMIQYLCNTTSMQQVQEIFNEYQYNWNQTAHPCVQSSLSLGHHPFYTRPERTITMIRHPLVRIASGFVHGLHDCTSLLKQNTTPSVKDMCKALDALDSNGLFVQQIKSLIYKYARCVSGCGTNMLAGRTCGEQPPRQFDAELKQRMESLAFVGITEEWEKTLCSFHVRFPRLNNMPYLSENINVRPTQDGKCQKNVLKILEEAPETQLIGQDPDWQLWRFAMYLFHNRLPLECFGLRGKRDEANDKSSL
jgi:hypothetical protein